MRNALIVALVLALSVVATGCYSTPKGGEAGVVRNGGPLDDRNIRQIVPQGAGNTWVGWFSETHYYPASDQQRIYKFDDAKDADAQPVTVPTKDGVRVRLTGTFYLNTAFDNTRRGERLIRAFDTAFGTRSFGTDGRKPWNEGGWPDFLNAVVQPVIDSNIREIIAEFDCRELVSSCALVQRGGDIKVRDVEGQDNASNIKRIQDRINENLTQEIRAKLGQPYFKNIRFSLGPVELPGVQSAIDTAQSAFASVSKSQAKVEQARKDRQANAIKQQGYARCRSCARQDELRALPRGLTALGGNFAVGVK